MVCFSNLSSISVSDCTVNISFHITDVIIIPRRIGDLLVDYAVHY